MMSLDTPPIHAVAHAITKAVMHSVWIAAVAAGAYALIRRYGGLGPRGRYGAGFALLCAAVLSAFAAFLGNLSAGRPSVIVAQHPLAIEMSGVGSLPGSGRSVLEGFAPLQNGAWSPLPYVVASAWLLGVTFLVIRTTLAAAWIRTWVDRRALPLPDDWAVRADAIARELGLDRAVRFVASRACSVPFTFGWISPVVVVPVGMLTGLPMKAIEIMLRHELCHIARRDYLMERVQCVAEALLFFHPLAWWLGREIRRERELACDEAVLALGANPLEYARALTDLEEDRNEWPAASLGANGGTLKMRILTILSPVPHRPRRAAGLAILPAVTLMVASTFVACEPLDPHEPPVATAKPAAVASDAPLDTAASPISIPSIGIEWLPDSVERHREAIEAASARAALDPELVALVVLVESGGDEAAVSPVGAAGLMQLMPETAERVAREVQVPIDGPDELFEPELNLRLGTTLLADLLRSEAARSAVEPHEIAWAAYNAGHAAVQEHLEQGRPLPEETELYVALLRSLYAERDLPESAAYAAWQARLAKNAAP